MNSNVANIIQRSLKNDKFSISAATGLVAGWETLNKFAKGELDQTMKTIYQNMLVGGEYPFLINENKEMTIQSTLAGDNGQNIYVNYTEYVSAGVWVNKLGKAVSNGVAAVTVEELDEDGNSVGNAQIMLPWRMVNEGDGTTTNAKPVAGVLTLKNAGTEYIRIDNGYNQSLTSVFAIPTGYHMAILGVGRSVIGNSRNAEFNYKFMADGRPNQVKRILFLSESADYEKFEIPFVFEGPAILSVAGNVGTGTAVCSAWYDAYLIETSVLKPKG